MSIKREEVQLVVSGFTVEEVLKEIETNRVELLKRGCDEATIKFETGVEPGYYDDPGEGVVYLVGWRPKTSQELDWEKKAAERAKAWKLEKLKQECRELGIKINE